MRKQTPNLRWNTSCTRCAHRRTASGVNGLPWCILRLTASLPDGGCPEFRVSRNGLRRHFPEHIAATRPGHGPSLQEAG